MRSSRLPELKTPADFDFSFRMRRHMELSRAIHPTASRALDAEKAQDGGES